MKTYYLVILIISISELVKSQSLSDDKRCKCICPKVSIVTNNTEIVDGKRIRYVANVPPNKCNCMDVVIPKIANQLNGKEGEFCPRCECKYENRNTTIIKVVVIIVIWIIAALVVYMAFLIVLDPLLNKRKKGSYQEHTNEEEDGTPSTSHDMSVRGNVLNRVGHQQDKWKRQVREQRRNIYDRHAMLN
ncbi:uncharacterized protein CG1161 isoform X2 [Harmonia axyridis]|uniref:uncharacterized protein CG1161 isoform X2 n=1 Tax=Harmonia axyridis TaxID=115357 RepID=UPI001E277911|nr:uncharacterized protein CG1161 isoform X2 [Harmonia axyridis]